MSFFLVIIEESGAMRRMPLGPEGLTVGRQAGNGLVLDDQQLSRRHARFALGANGPTVTDLGSANGTRVNGQHLVGTQALRVGDHIQLGATTLRVESAEIAAEATAFSPAPPIGVPLTTPLTPATPGRGPNPLPLILAVIGGVFLLLCVCGGATTAFVASRGGESGAGASATTFAGNTGGGTGGGAGSPGGGIGGGIPVSSIAPGTSAPGVGSGTIGGAGLPRGNYLCSTVGGSSILDQGWIHIVSADRYQWSENGSARAGDTQYAYRYDPTTNVVILVEGPLSDGREKRFSPEEEIIYIGFASQCPRRS